MKFGKAIAALILVIVAMATADDVSEYHLKNVAACFNLRISFFSVYIPGGSTSGSKEGRKGHWS